MAKIDVVVEVGTKKVFVSALDWPGWSRCAKSEELAMEVLADYADRYRVVADAAKARFPKTYDFNVAERMKGGGATDFGVPGAIAKLERQPASPREAERLVALVEASWNTLADVYDVTPEKLRKGPRGGGRDRDKMYEHVISAEAAYARMVGVRVKEPDMHDVDAINEMRDQIVDALYDLRNGQPVRPKAWPMRYAARRIAWHVLDHAWEMEDKAEAN